MPTEIVTAVQEGLHHVLDDLRFGEAIERQSEHVQAHTWRTLLTLGRRHAQIIPENAGSE